VDKVDEIGRTKHTSRSIVFVAPEADEVNVPDHAAFTT
jgi:hypothetical protein